MNNRPKVPLYQALARAFQQLANCERTGNLEWRDKTAQRIVTLCKAHLPSGAGIDNGVRLLDGSSANKLVFALDFHHMDEHGSYRGWTEHTAVVTPSLADGFELRITGRNRNDVKDYLHEVLYFALQELVDEYQKEEITK